MSNQASISGCNNNMRIMIARWVVTGEIMLKTATHLGGSADVAIDMPLLRDSKDGVPLLPGTSLAGALRSHLADILGGYRSEEVADVAALFGAAMCDHEGIESPLIVFDSLGRLPDGMAVEIRDGVALEPASGTAQMHKKFDMEVLPAGTVFPIRVELIISNIGRESKLINLLAETLNGLAEGEVSLGMRRSRGLGAIAAQNWRAIRYDLASQEGWLNYLTADALTPISDDVEAHSSPWKACCNAYASINQEELPDKRQRIIIEAKLSFSGGILVRSPAVTADAPDAVHLISGGRSILPGTSLAGVLRNRALRIARIVRNKKNDAEGWIERIFGSRLEENIKVESSASRLKISENVITDGVRIRPSRTRIDRFTQGVTKGALFDEEPHYDGKTTVRLELRKPLSGEAGLLLLLLKDLLSGDLNVGGAGSIGRGVIKGTAKIRFGDRAEREVRVTGEDLKVAADDRDFLNKEIEKFYTEVLCEPA